MALATYYWLMVESAPQDDAILCRNKDDGDSVVGAYTKKFRRIKSDVYSSVGSNHQ